MGFSYRVWLMILAVIPVMLLTACNTITNQDAIDDLETQNAQLQSTLTGFGTPALTMAALQLTATQSFLLDAEVNNARSTATAAELRALALQSTLTVLQGGGSAGVTVVQPTPLPPQGNNADQPASVPTMTPSPDPATRETFFSQTVTSTGRDQDDCAAGITATFDPTQDTIYVVTRINYLPAGSTFSARWEVNGELFFDDIQCWVPTQDWENICAYCSIVPDGATFPAGSWTVDLLLDGERLAQAQFQVVEPGGTSGADGAANTE
ncbi:MAG: hypothetical protein JXQ72_17580 [Anaerolineae bacterium]|nr:hypothetical protein [Anaerolineae bacterium]